MTSETLAEYADEGFELLNEYEAQTVLSEYGIPYADAVLLPYDGGRSGEAYLEAYRASDDPPDYPLYLKVASRSITSVSDAGGVVRVASADAFVPAVEQILTNVADHDPAAPIQGVIGAEAVEGDYRELLLGGLHDPQFGSVLSLGMGGIYVEVYRDVEFRVVPLAADDVRGMIRNLDGRAALGAFRGMDPVDEDALVEAVLAFSALLEENPNVTEADVNPLLVGPDGVVAADALIRLE